jgi:hypothetical protein
MQKRYTTKIRSPQVSSRTPADNTRSEWAQQKFRFLAAVKFKLSSDSGRKICEDHEVSHHLPADIANEIANSRHNSSVAHLRTFAHCKDRGGKTL